MSRYLVVRIACLPNVEVVTGAEITRMEGPEGVLEAVCWRRAGGAKARRLVRHLLLFTGATPDTEWLSGSGVVLDCRGSALTGSGPGAGRRLLETSCPGVFAIGDIRACSVKRVASAVGERAQAVAALHAVLASAAPVSAPA